MSGSLSDTGASNAVHEVQSRTPRCRHTLLTKPECHCPVCLYDQIAAHAPGAAPAPRGAMDVERAAA